MNKNSKVINFHEIHLHEIGDVSVKGYRIQISKADTGNVYVHRDHEPAFCIQADSLEDAFAVAEDTIGAYLKLIAQQPDISQI